MTDRQVQLNAAEGPRCMAGARHQTKIEGLERRMDQAEECQRDIKLALHGSGDEPGIKGRVERIETKLDEAHRHRNWTIALLAILVSVANFLAGVFGPHLLKAVR